MTWLALSIKKYWREALIVICAVAAFKIHQINIQLEKDIQTLSEEHAEQMQRKTQHVDSYRKALDFFDNHCRESGT